VGDSKKTNSAGKEEGRCGGERLVQGNAIGMVGNDKEGTRPGLG